jgi:hypothetical protein
MNELCTFERTYLPVRTKLGAGSGLPEAQAIDAQSGGACHERARTGDDQRERATTRQSYRIPRFC